MRLAVLDNSHVLAGWLEENNIFYYQWKGFVPAQAMQEIMEQILIHFTVGRGKLMMQDLRKLEAVNPATLEWLVTDWLPRAVQAGLTKVAILHPTSVFGQVSVIQARYKFRESNLPLQSGFFTSEQEAVAWLVSEDQGAKDALPEPATQHKATS